MRANRLKTVLIGFGKIGHAYAADPAMARYYPYATHAQVLAEHPRFEWSGVIDPDAGAQAAAKASWPVAAVGGEARDLGELANQVEVAVLATPPDGRAVLLEGFPRLRAVIVEKPLGRTAAESQAFLDRCAERNILVQVNLWRRGDDRFRELAAGRLHALVGPVQAVTAYFGNGLINNGTHMVDFARMLFGEVAAVERIGAAVSRVEGPLASDSNPAFALSFETGVTVMFQPLRFSAYRENGLSIWGECGRLDLLNEGLTLAHFPSGDNRAMTGEREVVHDSPAALSSTVGTAFYRLYDNLVSALDEGGATALWSPGQSALETSRVVDAVLNAPPTGERVPVAAAGGRRGVMFVEDPGAVNWIAPLAADLALSERPPLLLAMGLAPEMLRRRGLHPVVVSSGANAVERMAAIEPSWLAVGTSENAESPAFALVHAARHRHVPSVGLVDHSANAAFRFRGVGDDPLAHVPDRVLVGDDWTAKAFVDLGLTADRVVEVGQPHQLHLDRAAARLAAEGREAVRQRVLPAAARQRKVVVFVSEISTGLNHAQYQRSADYTLSGRGASAGRTEIVAEEFLDAIAAVAKTDDAIPFLVLRRHPKETAADLRELRPAFDYESREGDPLDLIYAADLVVGLSSQLLAEAKSLGVEVLSILPRGEEREWLAEVRRGDIPCVTSRLELRSALTRQLSAAATDTRRRPAASSPSALARVKMVLQELSASA